MAPTSVKGRPNALMTEGSPRWRSLPIHVDSGADRMMGMGARSHSSASRPSQPARASSLSDRNAQCLDVEHLGGADDSPLAGRDLRLEGM